MDSVLTPYERTLIGLCVISGVIGIALLVRACRLWLAERDARALMAGMILGDKGNGNETDESGTSTA